MTLIPIKSGETPEEVVPEKPTLQELRDACDTPGQRIRAYRNAAKLSQRDLAVMCNPPMDFTAIGRIERNMGYTSSTLLRLAEALNCSVSDFFLPIELVTWKLLPDDMRNEIAQTIKRYSDAAGLT